MRSTFKVLFYLKRDKQKSNGSIPLFCRITIDGKQARFSMKCDVQPKFWDAKANKALGRTIEATKINSLLDNTKAAIIKIYRDLQERDNYVTAEKVRNVFLGAEVRQQTILALFDRHNRERKSQIGINICQTNYDCYCLLRRRMADFLNRYHNVSDYAIKDIDHKFICDFEAYLISDYHLAENTRIGYLNRFRHVVSIAIEDEIITKNPFAKIPGQHKITDRGYLTQEEVEKVTNAKLEKVNLEQARDIFVFCCFTGLSYIDISLLTRDNIVLDFDGKLWIKGSRQKTGGDYNIPLLNVPKAILEKYRENAQGKFIFPVPIPTTYNYRLRKIAKICGIDKEITSHLARHTFATTITLTKGVPMETVSKMLGHKNLKTTQIYARVINRKISDDMLALSERLSDMENKLCVNF